jgi:tartrate dehydratase beta subunit/fumarate hydratase class I family protein
MDRWWHMLGVQADPVFSEMYSRTLQMSGRMAQSTSAALKSTEKMAIIDRGGREKEKTEAGGKEKGRNPDG